MFEEITDPGSLAKPTPEEKRQLRVRFGTGTFVFGLAVLLQIAHDYVRSPLFAHTRVAVLLLMMTGLTLQAWGARALTSRRSKIESLEATLKP